MANEPTRGSGPTRAGRSEAGRPTIEQEFDGFGERAGKFVRSVTTLTDFPGDLSNYVAEPTMRIVRTAFGKWSIDLLVALASHRHSSFGALRKLLPGISARVLSAKLKLFEQAGFVTRSVIPTRPPRPEYVLTERAQVLVRTSAKVLAYARATGATAKPPAPVSSLGPSAPTAPPRPESDPSASP